MTSPRLRLLFLLPFPPRPGGRHGGARVTGQLIAAMARRHEVGVLFLTTPGEAGLEDDLQRACAWTEGIPRAPRQGLWQERLAPKLRLLAGVPTWAGEVREPRLGARAAMLIRDWRPDVVQVEFPVMGQYLPAIAGCGGARVLVDHDASLRDLRTWRGPLGPLTGAVDARAWRRFERRVLDRVDAAVVFTERDRESLARLGSTTPVAVIPLGADLPLAPLDPLGTQPPEVLFVGNFAHPPNVDGAMWLARDVLPPLRARLPELRLRIVGPAPPPQLCALAGPLTAITGEVDDVTPHLAAAAVVAAPLRSGGGMRVKVLEAMAAGKAVVATPLAVQGLDVTPGVELEVADGAAAFQAGVARLIEDESLRRELAARARSWAEVNLGWERPVAAYERLYASLARAATDSR